MTRKDFTLIAETLREARPYCYGDRNRNDGRGHALDDAWTRLVEAFAERLHNDNPHFDAGRFYAACNGED